MFAAFLLCYISGFAIGALIAKNMSLTLTRSQYFVVLASIAFVVSCAPLLWFFGAYAYQNQMLFGLILLYFFVIFAAYVFLGMASAFRSLSAYGTTAKSWYGAIPFVFLVLCLKRPKPSSTQTGKQQLVSLFLILSGIVLFSMSGLLQAAFSGVL